MHKYTNVEKTEVLSGDTHSVIENELHKLGKTSARELTQEERDRLSQLVDESERN